MLLLASAVIFTHANIAFARCTSPSYYADAESQCNSLIERIVRKQRAFPMSNALRIGYLMTSRLKPVKPNMKLDVTPYASVHGKFTTTVSLLKCRW